MSCLKNIKSQFSIENLLGVFLILYGLFFFTLKDGVNFFPATAFFMSLLFLIREKKSIQFYPEERQLYLLLALYFFVSFFSLLKHDDLLGFLDEPSKFFLIIFIIVFLVRSGFKIEFFWFFVTLASISNILFVLFLGGSLYLSEDNRLSSTIFSHPLYFGNVSLVFSFLSLSGLIWTIDKSGFIKFYWVVLFLVGFISGLILSILSGTRGGWVAIPFATYFVLFNYAKGLDKKIVLNIGFSLLIFLIGAVILFGNTPVLERMHLTLDSFQHYFSGEDKNTSLGLRFEMWMLGFHQIIQNPLLGIGHQGYVDAIEVAVRNGSVVPEVSEFTQLHNQFLQEFVMKGVFGFLSLFFLFSFLVYFFTIRLDSKDFSIRSMAVSGAVTCFLYLDFFLSISMFHLNKTTLTFLIIMALTFGFIVNRERKEKC